jgi:phage/plasmid primase-like uncharacterized protein
MMSADAQSQFLRAMNDRNLTLAPGESLCADGHWHRADVVGKRRGNRDGSYILYLKPIPHGCINNWTDSCGAQGWHEQSKYNELTAVERKQIDEAGAKLSTEGAREQARTQARVQVKAQRMWRDAEPASPNHPVSARVSNRMV